LEGIQGVLRIGEEVAGGIPIFGDAAKAPFAVAAHVLGIIVTILDSIIAQIDRTQVDLELADGDCAENMRQAIQGVTRETLTFLEKDLPRHESKLDIIDTNNDENQELLKVVILPHLHSLVNVSTTAPDGPMMASLEGHRKLQAGTIQHQAMSDSIFIGAGCDGLDNDGDSILLEDPLPVPVMTDPMTFLYDNTKTVSVRQGLIDECDEDQIPPTITLKRDPPKTFKDIDEVTQWYENEDNLQFADDCAGPPALILSTSIEVGNRITVRVVDTRCSPETLGPDRLERVNDKNLNVVEGVIVDTSGAYFVERSFKFVLADLEPPVVSCGFHKRQDIMHVVNPPPGFVYDGSMIPPYPRNNLDEPLHIDARNEDGQDLVDIKLVYNITVSFLIYFNFNIFVNCFVTKLKNTCIMFPLQDNSSTDINVDITLLSNEYERNLEDMHIFLERNDIANALENPANSDFVHRATLFLSPYS
jgi:hypothetical protein